MDDWSPHGPGLRLDRHASDWGLVSLWVGGFFLVMAPIQLLFNDFYWAIGIHAAAPNEIPLARIVAPLTALMFLSLIGFGQFAGVRGFGLARKTGQPIALPLAGMLICGVDFALWIGLTINLMGILGMIL